MVNYKYEWPYIKYLTLEDQAGYVSDLPEDIDTLAVFHIKPTSKYLIDEFALHPNILYNTPEKVKKKEEERYNTIIWDCLYTFVLGTGIISSIRWYNTNLVENYKYFKTETWTGYIKLRFWPGLAVAWTAYNLLNQKEFNEYPKIF
jgi:hypothetical protein